MDLDDSKVKVDRFYFKKIVIGTIQEDQFMYILLEGGYKYSINGYNISFFNFPITFSYGLLSNLYYISLFISTLHVDNRLFVLILVLSAPP